MCLAQLAAYAQLNLKLGVPSVAPMIVLHGVALFRFPKGSGWG